MDLLDQLAIERATFAGRNTESPLIYARFVARNPWIFGRDRIDEARTAARRLLRELQGPPPSRWMATSKTTPSGKTILRCLRCGIEAPLPITCQRRCEDDYPELLSRV